MSAPSAASLRGQMLKAWLEYAGKTPAGLAQRLECSTDLVYAWIRGDRGKYSLGREEVRDISAALALPPADQHTFLIMFNAAGSVTDGLPNTRWAHNFPGGGEPGWVWLRPGERSTEIRAEAWWGEPFQATIVREVTPAGLFLLVPTTIANPPLEITMRPPGWADFGIGAIPDAVLDLLGADRVDGVSLLNSAPPTDPPLHRSDRLLLNKQLRELREVAAKLKISWSILRPHLGMARSDRSPYSLDGLSIGATAWPSEAHVDSSGAPLTQLLVTAEQAKNVRQARGITRKRAAELATHLMPRHEVPERAVISLESSATVAGVPQLLSRLDTVYRMDGRLGVERTFTSIHEDPGRHRRTYKIEFPHYWVGPIWLQVTNVDGERRGVVILRWGLWSRRQRATSGMVLTTRKALPNGRPLQVRIPKSWTVTAGTGASPSALDVNHGWWPVNIRATQVLLAENLATVRVAIAHQRTDADR